MAAIIKGIARQAGSRQQVNEGAEVYQALLRDGSAVTSDWKEAAIEAGFGYHVTVGALSTGIVGGGAGTVIAIAEPEMCLSIPNGVVIRPLRISVHVQSGAPADAEEVEILIAVDQDTDLGAVSVTNSDKTAESIYNMNTLCGKSSDCTCYSAFTSSISTDPVLDIELARKVIEYDVTGTGNFGILLDLLYEPVTPPIINGPAMILIYWGGDTATVGGFAEVEWLEFPESRFSI